MKLAILRWLDGLVKSLPKMTIEVLENAGAPKTIHKLFALWMKEIGRIFGDFVIAESHNHLACEKY